MKSVEILFGELLLKELLKKERISPGLVSSMATWQHSGFSTHSKPAPSDPGDSVFFDTSSTPPISTPCWAPTGSRLTLSSS